MSPGHYTELFFLDEPTALAAGHRPCACCRRADYQSFAAAWARAFPAKTEAWAAAQIDRMLREKTPPLVSPLRDLPDGCIVEAQELECSLWWHGKLFRWSHAGYGAAYAVCAKTCVRCVTSAPMVEVLRAGYTPWPPHVSVDTFT